jgi:hypothetical protein
MPHAMTIRFAPAVVLLLAFAADLSAQAPQEIRLWPGKAPGSEAWGGAGD